jgi:ribose transport system permease protein
MTKSKSVTRLLKVPSAAWVILIMVIIFTALSDKYLAMGNIVNIFQQNAVLLIVALGSTLVLLSEGIDLSAGSVLTLSGVNCVIVMLKMTDAGAPNAIAMLIGVMAGLFTGVLMGVVTGGLIAIGKLPPFIASLGTMGIGAALALVLTNSSAIYIDNPVYVFIGQKLNRFIDLPLVEYLSMPMFIAIAVFALVWVILYQTSFGRYIIAIGGNEAGTRLSGINTVFWKWMIYILAGVLAAIGGIVLAARLQAADSSVGVGMEFDAIAAAILGGTSFAKGKGGIAGTILGVLVIGVTRNGLNVVGVPSLWRPAITGSIIILAIVFEVVYSKWREGIK